VNIKYQPRPPLSKKARRYLRKVLPWSVYLKYFCRHEKMSLELWRAVAAITPDGFSILDIGAYYGEFAMAAREVNQSADVYAFEPNPESLKKLKEITRSHQINVVENAISDKNGELYFRCDSQRSQVIDHPSGDTIKVNSRTLDTWIKERQIKPFLLKIDVEEASESVILGAKAMLKDSRPLILCEILSDWIGAAVVEALPDFYNYYYINENKGLDPKSVVKRFDWRYRNWFFVPPDKENLIPQNLILKP